MCRTIIVRSRLRKAASLTMKTTAKITIEFSRENCVETPIQGGFVLREFGLESIVINATELNVQVNHPFRPTGYWPGPMPEAYLMGDRGPS